MTKLISLLLLFVAFFFVCLSYCLTTQHLCVLSKRMGGKGQEANTGEKKRNSLFICVEVLRLSQLNGVMSSAVILTNHTFTGQA